MARKKPDVQWANIACLPDFEMWAQHKASRASLKELGLQLQVADRPVLDGMTDEELRRRVIESVRRVCND